MTEEKYFANQDVPSVIDTEYRRCNFAHKAAIQVEGQWRGHRLFPGDDTPRNFIDCNLVNCELPPGSTVLHCNNAIITPEVFQGESADIIIDGESVVIQHFLRIVRGKWTPSGYIYFTPPKEYPFDKEKI